MSAAPESIWRVPGMPALLLVACTGFCGYAVLLPSAPLWAAHGGADLGGVGLVNAVMLLVTVATQLLVPAMLARWGWGLVLVAGMVLLGVGGILHLLSAALVPVLALSAVRGAGFGILTVVGSSSVAALTTLRRRGAGLGAYGLAVALPNLVLLPIGPWLAENVGFWLVFVIGAVPLAGIPACLRLAAALSHRSLEPATVHGTAAQAEPATTAYLRLLRPTVLLLAVTLAAGGVITFTAQMVSGDLLAVLTLFTMGLVGALSRWGVGTLADRRGAEGFLLPLTVGTVVGTALVAWAVMDTGATRVLPLLLGVVVLGLSYGALQNLTLVVAFAVVSRAHQDRASAVWNVGFDAGTAIGSVSIGLLASGASFGAAFLVVAGLCLLVVPVAMAPGRRSI